MARLTENLTITTSKHGNFSYSVSENYTEAFTKVQIVDNSDGFISLMTTNTEVQANSIAGAKAVIIKNNGLVAAEIQLKLVDYLDNSNVDDANSVDLGPGSATVDRNISMILAAGEYLYLPTVHMVSYAESASAANAKPTTVGAYVDLDTNEYVDSTADVDSATADGVVNHATATRVYLEPYTSATDCTANLFHVGDLIRIRDEVMEVTAIGDKSNLANNYLDVIRGTHGSTAGTAAADDDAVRLPFFNAYHDYDKFSVPQTDKSGKFKSMNFFGYGRVADSTSDGIVPGSIAGKFYNSGYQSLGMSGITGDTNSGLAASTQYKFNLTVDGGSVFENLTFTTDSTNLNFGGANGIVNKIQTALNAQYYTSGNLFEKRVNVSIVGGDIRFTSGQRLSGSAILLAAPTSGTTPFGVGRVPAIGNVNSPVPANVPTDKLVDVHGIARPNTDAFFYDDGHGNIAGAATGSINYTTGKIDFTGPPNAEFVITANYDSAHGGGPNTSDTNVAGAGASNVITQISARSCNSKINCPIEIAVFN